MVDRDSSEMGIPIYVSSSMSSGLNLCTVSIASQSFRTKTNYARRSVSTARLVLEEPGTYHVWIRSRTSRIRENLIF